MKWLGHVAHIGETRGACEALLGKSEKNTPIGSVIVEWILTL
jgi:hypothetical protein